LSLIPMAGILIRTGGSNITGKLPTGGLFSDFENSGNLIPYAFFSLVSVIVTFYAIWLKWSLIPVLGLLANLYLMSELGITNWMRFGIWLIIGLILYFSYGSRKSRLNHPDSFD
jgi:hypothetical protein